MKYTLIEKILVQGIAFLQGVILARLLSPSDFGLAAMLGLFLMVGGSLAESGLGSAYVVYGGDTRRVLKWNLSAALLIYLALAFAAPLIAAFYNEPILRELTWVMGIGIVINAASVVDYARLQREKRFAALSFVNTSVTFGTFLLALIFALSGFGVWTIAWMSVGAAILKLLTLKLALHHSQYNTNTSTLSSDFSKLISYGLKTMISGLIHTVYLNSYQLIIGKTANPAAVGLFSRGQRWAALPDDVVNDSVSRVAFPSFVAGDISARRMILINAALLWPCLAALWLFAPELVGLVFGSAWLEAVPYLRILILGVLFTPLCNISLNYLRAKGRADLVLVTDAIKKPLQIAALVCGVCVGTVEALCWAKVASDIFEAAVDFLVAWWCRWSKEYMWSHTITLTGTKTGELLKASHESGVHT